MNIVGGTGTSATNSITVTWGSGAAGSVSVNYTDPDGPCTAAAPTVKSIVINALPVVSDVTLLADVGTSPSTWSWPVNGTFNNFNMCIDPLVVYPSFYFLDIDDLTSSVPLKTGVMNGFKLDQASLPGNWLDYWDGKGCQCLGSTRNLQYVMWPIINGDEPIFYIHYDGSDYEMVDGMTWQFASAMVPLQVSGDYPEWNYKSRDRRGC
ncbi:MAG: hypothetical protein MZV63_56155 [Marinilabiliales bacterium]|nr:hypothetical protein [Marinilabiliales bacterium]